MRRSLLLPLALLLAVGLTAPLIAPMDPRVQVSVMKNAIPGAINAENGMVFLLGGDGFVCRVDPHDPERVFVGTQEGPYVSRDGGAASAAASHGQCCAYPIHIDAKTATATTAEPISQFRLGITPVYQSCRCPLARIFHGMST